MHRSTAILPITLLLFPLLVTAQATSPPSPASPTETVELYSAAWSQPDTERRRELLEQAWAVDGVYLDPTAEVLGRDALIAHIGGFLHQSQGARLVLTSGVDVHHGVLRFRWKMVAADGKTELVEGLDYGELDQDGRLKRIVGFFGPFPTRDSAP